MNLNKTHKQAIVKAVIADVPRAHKDLSERAQKIVDADVQKYAPKEIAVIAKDPTLSCYLSYGSSNIGYYATNPRHDTDFAYTHLSVLAKHSVSDGCRAAIRELIESAREESKAIKAASDALAGAIFSIRTVKAFVNQFPELAKYAPAEPTTGTNLPAIANVMADLSKLGWPKGKEVAEAV